MGRRLLRRLGPLAAVTSGIFSGLLLVGFDYLHVHSGDGHQLVHRHLHAGDHGHDHPLGHHPGVPEHGDESDRKGRPDTILSFDLGAPLMPPLLAIQPSASLEPGAGADRSRRLRAKEIRSSGHSRAPPA